MEDNVKTAPVKTAEELADDLVGCIGIGYSGLGLNQRAPKIIQSFLDNGGGE